MSGPTTYAMFAKTRHNELIFVLCIVVRQWTGRPTLTFGARRILGSILTGSYRYVVIIMSLTGTIVTYCTIVVVLCHTVDRFDCELIAML